MRWLLFRHSCSKIFVIPLFLLKKFLYSIIPPKKHTLFHYSKKKISVILIPLFLFSPRIFSVTGLSSHEDIYAIPVPIRSVAGPSSHEDIYAIPRTYLQCDRAE